MASLEAHSMVSYELSFYDVNIKVTLLCAQMGQCFSNMQDTAQPWSCAGERCAGGDLRPARAGAFSP